MVKGVNKNIIEISDPGHAYFERAILFVRQSGKAMDDETLSHRAKEYMSQLRMRRRICRTPQLVRTLLFLLGGAALGAAMTAAFLLL